MGNFEKLVVLTVLFLSAIVLAFSLNDDGVVEAAAPLEAARKAMQEEASTDRAKTGLERDRTGLLNSEVTPRGSEADEVPGNLEKPGSTAQDGATSTPVRPGLNSAGRGTPTGPHEGPGRLRILRDATGLEVTSLDEFHVYEVQEGDTWNALARRFYRDTSFLPQLRTANEELTDLVAGERILVPVYDLAFGAGERAPYEPTARRESTPSEKGTASGVRVVVIGEGDTLSSISKDVFGTTTRWEEIYEANTDVLSSPDRLKLGMKLRIPRGE
jgi:nucleoid-associated protein YgaU